MKPGDSLVILSYTHLFQVLYLVSGPDLQQGQYKKSWDALRKAKSPADLALFAHYKIKENGREKKKTTKTWKSCIVELVQATENAHWTSGTRRQHGKQRTRRGEEINNTQCEILVYDTLVKHINMNHDRISLSVL